MSTSSKEIELKLEIPAADQDALKRAAAPSGFTASRAVTKTLQSIYFDTLEQNLRRAGASLRLRKVGRSWVQTVKIGTKLTGGLSSPIEAENRVTGGKIDLASIEDPKALRIVADVLQGVPVEECFQTIMKRTTRHLSSEDGCEIEVAFDTGDVKAGENTKALAEVELELKSGAPVRIFEAAKEMLGPLPFRFSPHSKAERGFRLAEGLDNGPLEPQAADKIRLTSSDTAEEAFHSALRSCIDQIAHNRLVVLESEDAEGPHQLRIGLRRLRSALRLFRPLINDETRLPIDEAAREIGAAAGALRDIDVLMADIVAPVGEAAPENLPLDPLLDHLAKVRTGIRAKVQEQLKAEEFNAFLFDLAAYAAGRGWLAPADFGQTSRLAQPVARFSASALNKQWKKVGKYGNRIDELTIPERHEMRKALKKMRYGIEFFSSLYPASDMKPFLKRMKRLQNIFGYLNDVAMAETLVDLPAPRGAAAGQVSHAAGFVIGWHESESRHAWQHAKDYWTETRKAPKFWRG